MTYLAGDLGGTKTLLGLYDDSGGRLYVRRFDSAGYPSLGAMVAEFLGDPVLAAQPRPSRAAFGVAGPVVDLGPDRQQARITNLHYLIDTQELSGLGRVRLVNDFYAVAAAAVALAARGEGPGLVPLNPGAVAVAGGALAVLGAGTGLGEALVARPRGGPAIILPSEGGHSDFAPRDEVEIALLRFLQRRHGSHVSYERVLCGAGLLALYEFFCELRGGESQQVRKQIDADRVAAPAVVSRHGLAGTDPLCSEALTRFCSIYGAEAGNLALKGLASGGVFIAGGIAAKILPRLADGPFLEGFLQKGRFTGLLSGFPVHVMADPESGLLGAAEIARSP